MYKWMKLSFYHFISHSNASAYIMNSIRNSLFMAIKCSQNIIYNEVNMLSYVPW